MSYRSAYRNTPSTPPYDAVDLSAKVCHCIMGCPGHFAIICQWSTPPFSNVDPSPNLTWPIGVPRRKGSPFTTVLTSIIPSSKLCESPSSNLKHSLKIGDVVLHFTFVCRICVSSSLPFICVNSTFTWGSVRGTKQKYIELLVKKYILNQKLSLMSEINRTC